MNTHKPIVIFVGILFSYFGWLAFAEPTDQVIAQAAPPRSLYLFGDSWMAQMEEDHGLITLELAQRDLSELAQVISFAESGSTAEGWASDNPCTPDCIGEFSRLKSAIAADPVPNPVVFFTLGGNDLLGKFVNGPTDTAYTEIASDYRTILQELAQTRDDVDIVIGGYDLLNPEVDSIRCNLVLNILFGSVEPADTNPYSIQLFETIEGVAAEFENATTINTYGSLQRSPGNPTISSWSPVEYIADCIHLNESGYKIYLDTIFDQGLESRFSNMPQDPEIFIFLPSVRR